MNHLQDKYEKIRVSTNLNKITLAGGCFWCIEAALEPLAGVVEVFTGYCGGKKEKASYDQVSQGTTEHKEAVQVFYNKQMIPLEKILEEFFIYIDPTDAGGQFADRGKQYTTAIFYHNQEQKNIAERKLEEIKDNYQKPIVTEILPYSVFYLAEPQHQDFYLKNTEHYQQYEENSGRAKHVRQQKQET
jgi:methionine-S-sulfoxide reductase